MMIPIKLFIFLFKSSINVMPSVHRGSQTANYALILECVHTYTQAFISFLLVYRHL